MKLSIITVNKDNEAGLARTIQSVIDQTFRDFEYIIIDGASSDGSVEVIKKHEDKIDYWISEPDTGIYNAMNKGIRIAKGEYLLFLNSGDIFASADVLKKLFAYNLTEDIVFGNTKIKSKILKYPDKLTPTFWMLGTICHQSVLFKKTVFDRELYDEKYKLMSDWKFLLKCYFFEKCSFRHINITISDYDDSGLSSQNLDLLKNEKQKILEELFPKLGIEFIDLYEKHQDCKKELNTYKRSRLIRFITNFQRSRLYLKIKAILKF